MLEDFLALFRGEKPRHPVWTADITYWISGMKQKGTADPAWDTEDGYLNLHNELGVLPYYDYAHFWAGSPEYDQSVTIRNEWKPNRTQSWTPCAGWRRRWYISRTI